MKKEIKIEVNSCDNCHRDDMELQTCIGCGITLCSFCGDDVIGGTMEEHNRFRCFASGYRRFWGFKYDWDLKEMFFCLNCLKNPNTHKVTTLLSACIKKEKMREDHDDVKKKNQLQMEIIINKIHKLTYNATDQLRKKGIELIPPEKD